MENFKIKLKGIYDTTIIKCKEFYNFLLVKTNNRPYIIRTAWGILLLLIVFFFVLIFSWSNWENNEDATVETWEVIVEEPEQNPPLLDSQKIELCSAEANKMLRSAYDFKWEIWNTTNFSATEESHQLRWVAELDNEESVLAQCNIESGRYRDTEVRVSFLDEKYYSLEKFNIYQKHCEGLWWKIKSRWWYGHWMIWSCEFDNWNECDLRELYRWTCRIK